MLAKTLAAIPAYNEEVAIGSTVLRCREYVDEVLVLVDGDGQHDPAEIPNLLAPVLRGEADLVCGMRWKGNTRMPLYRRVRKRVLDYATAVGYDPVANANFARVVPEVALASSANEALQGAEGCILQADWPEFSALTADDFRRAMREPVVVDGRRILDPAKMNGVRFRRIG